MSAPAITLPAWQWPTEVLEFAAGHQVQPYLDPLREALGDVFPTAQAVRVVLEPDPEIRDDWHIVFEVRVPQRDVADYVEAKRLWHRKLFALCPAPLVCTFSLSLILVTP